MNDQSDGSGNKTDHTPNDIDESPQKIDGGTLDNSQVLESNATFFEDGTT